MGFISLQSSANASAFSGKYGRRVRLYQGTDGEVDWYVGIGTWRFEEAHDDQAPPTIVQLTQAHMTYEITACRAMYSIVV